MWFWDDWMLKEKAQHTYMELKKLTLVHCTGDLATPVKILLPPSILYFLIHTTVMFVNEWNYNVYFVWLLFIVAILWSDIKAGQGSSL